VEIRHRNAQSGGSEHPFYVMVSVVWTTATPHYINIFCGKYIHLKISTGW